MKLVLKLVFLALLLFCSPYLAYAHTLGQTYLYLGISDHEIDVRFEVTAADLNQALNLDLPTDGTLKPEDLQPHSAGIADYLSARVSIAPDGKPVTLKFVEHTLRDIQLAQYVLSHFIIEDREAPPEFIDFDYSVMFDADEKHTGILVIENNWRSNTFDNEAGIALVFEDDSRQQRLDMSADSLWTGFRAMIRLGFHHILEGLDHILFLIAIMLPAVVRREQGRWQFAENFSTASWHILKVVTIFTIAHSITLSLAALEILLIPPRLVESVIAASIAIAALDIFVPILRGHVGIIVFLFGLFHGAGFAGVLLDMNIHSDYMVLTLLGFNIGVELGQIAIVLVVFPILYLIRTSSLYLRFGMQAIAAGLMAIGLYWFTERAFNVDLPAGEYAQKLLAMVI